MAKTKHQKGVKIARDGASAKFTVSWDHGQKKYTDQKMIWYEVYSKTTDKNKKKRYEKAHSVDLTKGAKSKSFTITWGDYPPTGTKRLCSIKVKLRAKSKSGWSDWTSRTTFDVQAPKTPTFNADQKPAPIKNANTATYTWNVYDSGSKQMYHWSHYQVVELTNFDGTSIDEVTWGSKHRVQEGYLPYSTISPYNTIDVPLTILPKGTETVTQFFRVRTYGPQGFSSKWATSWHVFGVGQKAKDTSVKSINTPDGYVITVTWNLGTGKYRLPSDEVVVRYAIVSPKVTMHEDGANVTYDISCPNDPAPSWTERSAVTDTKYSDRLTFTVDSREAEDEVMFVQVNNKHDTDDTTRYGDIVPIKHDTLYGKLASPVLRSADYDPATHLVTINIDHETAVTNSYTAVYVKRNDEEPIVYGIIPYNKSSETIALPDDFTADDSITFGVQNYIADYSYLTVSGITTYRIGTVHMSSSCIWAGGAIAKPPTVSLSNPEAGVILVEWDWSWKLAQSAELSWSMDKHAWESTEEPSRYVVSNNHAARWRITNLDYGRYYVRVRLIKSGDNYETYGLYSDEDNYIDLTADVPPTPTLTVEPAVVAPGNEVRCYWQYAAEDGSSQLQADIYEAFVDNNGNITYSEEPLVVANTGQHLTLDIDKLGWTAETSPRYLAMETISTYGTRSDRSAIASVQIVDPLEVDIEFSDGFSTTSEDDISYHWLNRFPFTVNVVGSDYNGTTSFYIRRTTSYLIDRPDGDTAQGYEGEAVFIATIEGETSLVIEANDPRIVGSLDDGVRYDMVIIARDQYGQTDEKTAQFTIDWDHKAVIPSASILMDYDNSAAILQPDGFPWIDFYMANDHVYVEADDENIDDLGEMSLYIQNGRLYYDSEDAYADFDLAGENLIVTTTTPASAAGDVCDIYRLTADKPELVYEGAQFGSIYVDPYPALGRNGGYRFVYRTKYNDFKTEEGIPAWADYGWAEGATLNVFDTIIDFDGYQIHLPFNLDLSHSWEKDFTETKYLGGSIQGDWNPAVSHTLSVNTDVAVEYFSETARLMRLLATYPGVCHVRTPDGSSFSANVVVGENREEKMISKIAKFSLDITRVDQEIPDGMTYEEWIGMITEE